MFARLQRLPELASDGWLFERLASRPSCAGIDVPFVDDEITHSNLAAMRAHFGLRAILHVTPTPSSADGASPAAHVAALKQNLEAIAPLGDAVAHVVIHVAQPSWQSDDALEYLRGALPLGAALLERAPHIGESTRETDAFGGRPVHLHGVSHACRSSDWGTALPVGEATDVFPIVRLSLDPRPARHLGVFDEHEHVDHIELRPSSAALSASTTYWRGVRRVMERKAQRGAPEMLCSVPQQVAMQDPQQHGLREAQLVERLLFQLLRGVTAPSGEAAADARWPPWVPRGASTGRRGK